MHRNARIAGGGVVAAIAAGLGLALLRRDEALDFATVERDGAFSVRDYPRLVVAETIEAGPRQSALSRGFMALVDYVCAAGARIPLTLPVLADGDEDGRGWRTRFVLPPELSPESLPVPPESVAIRALEPRRLAAMRFSGEANDSVLASHEADLRRWMEDHGLRAAGPVEHAFYNSPIAPGTLRRNEVLIPLAA